MITSKEWYIMKILWKEKRCTLMEIVEKVQKETKWSKSTKYFYPLVEKEEAMIPETRSFLGRIYDGSVGALMNTLIRQGNLSEKDLDELEEILHNARKKADTQEE